MKRLLLVLPLVLCGCSTVTLQDRESGFLLTRNANALAKSGIGTFEVTVGKDGTRTIKMTSYQQESADSWAGVIKAAFEAGVAAGKMASGFGQ